MDQRAILSAAADCIDLGVHPPSGGRGSCRAERPTPLGRARLPPSRTPQSTSGGRQQNTKRSNFRVIPRYSAAIISRRAETPQNTLSSPREGTTTTKHAQISALFRVILRPSFPAKAKHLTTYSIFRVIPRYSAAIVSRRGETQTSQITSAGSAGASPSQGHLHLPRRYDHQRRHQHKTRSIFCVIPRHSAAIISRQAETHTSQITSAARQEPRPPKGASTSQDATADHGDNNTQHAQISALFRVLPRLKKRAQHEFLCATADCIARGVDCNPRRAKLPTGGLCDY